MPHLYAFTRGLRRDRDAVASRVTPPHHNGTNGGDNKTGLLKRQIFGRAGFALLRHRILLGWTLTNVTPESENIALFLTLPAQAAPFRATLIRAALIPPPQALCELRRQRHSDQP